MRRVRQDDYGGNPQRFYLLPLHKEKYKLSEEISARRSACRADTQGYSKSFFVFEQAKELVTFLNRAHCAIAEGNLESQKEFLKKIGSNFILKERRLIFSTEGTFRLFLKDAPFHTWRGRRDLNPRSEDRQSSVLDQTTPRPLSCQLLKTFKNLLYFLFK